VALTGNKRLRGALAALAFVLGTLAFLSPARALTSCSVSGDDLAVDAEEAQMLALINDYRSRNGLNSLSLDSNVTRASAWFSRDMATADYFPYDHVDRLGRSIGTRLAQCDASAPGWAENIAAGNGSASATFEQWRLSAGHNAAMLRSDVTRAGIARAYNAAATYDWYWALDLTAGATGTTPTTTSGAAGNKAPSTSPPPPAGTSAPSRLALPSLTPTEIPAATPEVSPTIANVPLSTPDLPPTITNVPPSTPGVPVTTDAPEITDAALTTSTEVGPTVLSGVCAILGAQLAAIDGQLAAVRQAIAVSLGLAQPAAVVAQLDGVRARTTADIDAARAAAGCAEPAVTELDLLTAATAS